MDFESVRATCSTREPGLWYFEVTMYTSGVVQLGWATAACRYQTEHGRGIGDDTFSLAFDGARGVLWHNGASLRHDLPHWKPGDVVGCFLDTATGRFAFALNGSRLPWAQLPVHPGFTCQEPFFPAVSLMAFQHVRFNFGTEPYRFAPLAGSFRGLNDVGTLAAADKINLPRLAVLAGLSAGTEIIDDRVLCQICFAEPPAGN
jgi:hypothetical protein